MHYVYSDNSEAVPENVRIFELPEGGWVAVENGQRRTITALKDEVDGVGISRPQDPTKYTVVDLAPDLREQLNRIEKALKPSDA